MVLLSARVGHLFQMNSKNIFPCKYWNDAQTQFKNAIKKIVMSMKINNHLRPVSPSARDTYGSINGSIYLKMEKENRLNMTRAF